MNFFFLKNWEMTWYKNFVFKKSLTNLFQKKKNNAKISRGNLKTHNDKKNSN